MVFDESDRQQIERIEKKSGRVFRADVFEQDDAPARYDDELELTTRIAKQTFVRYDHAYVLRRGPTVLAEGTTTIACVGRDGRAAAIPESLRRAD